MRVEFVFFGPVRREIGVRETTKRYTKGATVDDLLDDLGCEFDKFDDLVLDDTGSIRGDILITINSHHLHHLNGRETSLSDGDIVRFTPHIQGG